MSDEYQIEIPPSFTALYSDARHRLTVPLRTLRDRYEVCEDLAQHLTHNATGPPNGDPHDRLPRAPLRRWLHIRDRRCVFPGSVLPCFPKTSCRRRIGNARSVTPRP